MKSTFQELLSYLKAPTLEKDANDGLFYRFQKLVHLLMICILTGMILSPIFGIIEKFKLIDLDNHAVEKLLESESKLTIFFITVIMAPVVEELIFRGPLTLFKQQRLFSFIFYSFAFLFGLVHITNYEISRNVILLTPILVAPQFILGTYLGFIRIRFGLLWSILLHASYNAFFMFITFVAEP
ncbi:CPBP family intramembrane glutamic endopeptidase [Tenacibaculum xiamenense]|uniref:CPBP family intramembrane glutamic endopeptidase n=1 Tax=Tenacibaculum xiamenense TaxID=1261553 RepID=UPI003894FB40